MLLSSLLLFATQGSVGASSTATSTIEITIPPRVDTPYIDKSTGKPVVPNNYSEPMEIKLVNGKFILVPKL